MQRHEGMIEISGGENRNNKKYLGTALLKADAINYCQCMSPVLKTINNLPWCLFLTVWLSIIKSMGVGYVERWLLNTKKPSQVSWFVLNLSALFSFKYIFRSRIFFVHPGVAFFWFPWSLLKRDWLQNIKTPNKCWEGERREGFFTERSGGSPPCDSVHLSALLFCTCTVLAGNYVWCVVLPGTGCTRWWQWRLIRQDYTGCGFPAKSLASSFQPLVEISLLCLRSWSWSLSELSEWLCFTTTNLS